MLKIDFIKNKLRKVLMEATADIKTLHPNLGDKIPPILLTWDEYFNKINGSSQSHPNTAYNYNYDKENKFSCESKSKCEVIRTKTIGKITLKFILVKRPTEYAKYIDDKYVGIYSEDELINMGRNPYQYSIVCTHNDIIVGEALDEWGCVLIFVVKEYKNLGIGEELVKMYREIYPYKPSGGFTQSGYQQFKKYYNWMVKRALSNGVYSDLVRKGELTIERAKEIISSVDKNYSFSTEKTNKLKDYYGGNNQPLYIIEENGVIIFDSALKDVFNDNVEIPDNFIEELVYCYVYVVDFNGYAQLFNCYGKKEYVEQAIEILTNLNPDGLGDYYFKNFNPEIKSMLQEIWGNEKQYEKKILKDKGYISSVPLTIIKPKRNIIGIINQLKNITKLWFKKNDKYEELYNKIIEFAYGIVE